MLPGVGAVELIVIAIVALIVVGPKELPLVLRKLGQAMGRMRGMAAEFRASFDEMSRQAELDELRKEIDGLRDNRFMHDTRDEVEGAFRAIDQDLTAPGLAGMAQLTPHADEMAREAADDAAYGEAAHSEVGDETPELDFGEGPTFEDGPKPMMERLPARDPVTAEPDR